MRSAMKDEYNTQLQLALLFGRKHECTSQGLISWQRCGCCLRLCTDTRLAKEAAGWSRYGACLLRRPWRAECLPGGLLG